jgi:hypothetical protein
MASPGGADCHEGEHIDRQEFRDENEKAKKKNRRRRRPSRCC